MTAGPLVAGLLLTTVVDGQAGLRRLGARLRRWRVGVHWYLVALLTGPLVMGATAYGLSLFSPRFYAGFGSAADLWRTVLAGLALGLMVGVCEELGWTGFALPRLRQHHGVLVTGVVMGMLWGTWHLPMFAGSTDPSGALPATLVVTVYLFAWLPPYRVLLVWVYDRTDSLPLAVLMHLPISATAVVLGSMASEATTGVSVVIPALAWGAAFWLVVAGVAWSDGGHLTRRRAPQHVRPGTAIVSADSPDRPEAGLLRRA